MTDTLKLTTRGPKVAMAIRDRKPFTTHGALRGGALRYLGSGRLRGDDVLQWSADYEYIDYVVYSYATPIAWHVASEDRWYKVKAKFTLTTTQHQGNLYLVEATPMPEFPS